MIGGNTLYIASEGAKKAVVEYRPPQRTALYMDGSETPIVVPLPGLVMGRVSGGDLLRYGVYAVKKRPDNAGHTAVQRATAERRPEQRVLGIG